MHDDNFRNGKIKLARVCINRAAVIYERTVGPNAADTVRYV